MDKINHSTDTVYNYMVFYEKGTLFVSFITQSNSDQITQNFLTDVAEEVLIQNI